MTAARVPERLERGRLIYERAAPVHADDHARLLLDARVIPTLWPFAQPPTREDSDRSLRSTIAHWETHGFGWWMVRDRGSGAIVGRGGLEWIEDLHVGRAVEAGWLIDPERWGEGLATEIAVTAAQTAFGPLGLDTIVAVTLPGNAASRRVMAKTGFGYEADTVHANLDHVLYRLSATDFAQTAASGDR